jgi:hypothetical protein
MSAFAVFAIFASLRMSLRDGRKENGGIRSEGSCEETFAAISAS